MKKNIFIESINKHRLVIITTKSCQYCINIKDLLKDRQIKYREIIYSPLIEQYFTKKFNYYPYVPRVIYNKIFIGGFEDLQKKIDNNEFNEKKEIPKKKSEKKEIPKKKSEKKEIPKKKLEKKEIPKKKLEKKEIPKKKSEKKERK